MMKPLELLRPSDLSEYPVWMFVSSPTGEIMVRPVKRLPVGKAAGKMIGTRVRLANSERVWALLGNIAPQQTEATRHFLTISFYRDGKWFHLARYFDPDRRLRGPEALALFLGLRVDDVFPLFYDVREHIRGKPDALAGLISKEPEERFTKEQLIAMAVPEPPEYRP